MTKTVPAEFRPVHRTALPIFRYDKDIYSVFYTPGYLAVVQPERADKFEAALSQNRVTPTRTTLYQKEPIQADEELAITCLQQAAMATQKEWQAQQTRPFQPVCLTLYLHNRCNLSCVYCYADATADATNSLSIQAIRSGAELVAQHCLQQNRPFTVVFHGGGEPMLQQELAEQALDTVEAVAAGYQLPIFRYGATNGVMSPAKAAWMAQRFDRIGLSCDGPPAIQDLQRPLKTGGGTSSCLERTAHIIRDTGTPFQVRVTLTPASFRMQPEIVDYICRTLQPQKIAVEPVYQAGRATEKDCFSQNAVNHFVTAFVAAQKKAGEYHIAYDMAGNRLWELHGPYCNVFRQVLNLVPGDVATACFKMVTATQTCKQQFAIGSKGKTPSQFTLNHPHIQILQQQLLSSYPACKTCFNQYHCVRLCPHHCVMSKRDFTPEGSFRCQLQKTLIQVRLLSMAAALQDQLGNNLSVVISPVFS